METAKNAAEARSPESHARTNDHAQTRAASDGALEGAVAHDAPLDAIDGRAQVAESDKQLGNQSTKAQDEQRSLTRTEQEQFQDLLALRQACLEKAPKLNARQFLDILQAQAVEFSDFRASGDSSLCAMLLCKYLEVLLKMKRIFLLSDEEQINNLRAFLGDMANMSKLQKSIRQILHVERKQYEQQIENLQNKKGQYSAFDDRSVQRVKNDVCQGANSERKFNFKKVYIAFGRNALNHDHNLYAHFDNLFVPVDLSYFSSDRKGKRGENGEKGQKSLCLAVEYYEERQACFVYKKMREMGFKAKFEQPDRRNKKYIAGRAQGYPGQNLAP